MNYIEPTKEEITALYPKVAEIMADALGLEPVQITPEASLIDDLGGESIDFLDLVFRLERTFKVKIPRGKIIEDARGTLSEAEFEKAGILTDAGFEQLRSFLSEVPADRFKKPLRTAEIPRLFTAETFCKIVIRQQKSPAAAA